MTDREIFSHTGYPGGQKRLTPIQMLEKDGNFFTKTFSKRYVALKIN